MQNKKVAKGRRGRSVVSRKETYYTLLKKGYKSGRKKGIMIQFMKDLHLGSFLQDHLALSLLSFYVAFLEEQ